MTRYLFDTNIISDLIKNPRGKVYRRLSQVGDRTVFTSIIVAAELRYGCDRRGSDRLRRAIEQLLIEIPALPFDAPADSYYGSIRTKLEASGTPIGGNDLLIAAHTLSSDATLVTANEREFKRVPGLKVENWLS